MERFHHVVCIYTDEDRKTRMVIKLIASRRRLKVYLHFRFKIVTGGFQYSPLLFVRKKKTLVNQYTELPNV